MRLLNRPLAFILAAALAVAAIIVIIEVIAAAAHHGPRRAALDHLVPVGQENPLEPAGHPGLVGHLDRDRRCDSGRGAQAPPRHPAVAALASRATDAAVTRGGLAGTLRAAATGIDGISAAAVTVRRRRARVAATAAARGRPAAEALSEPVTQAVQDRLDGWTCVTRRSLRVRVNSRSR